MRFIPSQSDPLASPCLLIPLVEARAKIHQSVTIYHTAQVGHKGVNPFTQSDPSSMETSHTQLVSHGREFQHLYPLFKDIEESSQCAQGEESKRTSWILRATILGFIYTQAESVY